MVNENLQKVISASVGASNRIRVGKIADKSRALRAELWPDAETFVWDRKQAKGFTTIPRIVSYACLVIEEMGDKRKGNPTRVYIDLWCRIFDEQFTPSGINADDAAYACGYAKDRGVRTWKSNVTSLGELGFIKIASKGHTEIGFILMVNPYVALAQLFINGRFADKEPLWKSLRERCTEIGSIAELDAAVKKLQQHETAPTSKGKTQRT